MARVVRPLTLAFAAALALLASAGRAAAQGVVVSEYCPPTVAYYEPARVVEYERPAVTYYAPRVSYYPVRSVAYYDAPVVSYYPSRSVSYYAAPVSSYYPGAVSVTRYGLFGRPRSTTTYYP